MTKERLSEDVKAAMKQGNADLVSTLRFLLAQIQTEEIKNRGNGGDGTLSEEAVIAVLKSEAKRRNEAMLMFKEGKRDDLVLQEEKAMTIIKAYLPPEIGRDQVKAVVQKLNDAGSNDFTSLMKGAMAELRGQADGKTVSEIVKEVLG